MKKICIPILSVGEEPILAGQLSGRRAFVKVLEAIPSLGEQTLIVLDFRGVELATSSYLSEAILPLRDHLRLRRPPAYVVLANLTEKVREEFEELLNRIGDAILVCELAADEKTSNASLVGTLDQKLQDTFDLICSKRETTATELHAESSNSSVGATAWNNRLSALTSKSLVIEIPEGRTKKYRTLLEVP